MKSCSIKGCGNLQIARGWCAMHYARWRHHGDPLTVKQDQMHGATIQERWSANVERSSGCWEWSGYRDPNGYGRMNIGDRPILAHRVSWEIHNGPITSKQHVLHRCDNPPCVRPEHLFLGDQVANTADKMAKKRHRYGVSRGSDHGCAILDEAQVLAIRASELRNRQCAEQFGVSY